MGWFEVGVLGEAVEPLLLLRDDVAGGLGSDQLGRRGGVAGKGFFVFEESAKDHGAYDAADEDAADMQITEDHIFPERAVFEHLIAIHSAPLRCGVWVEIYDAG